MTPQRGAGDLSGALPDGVTHVRCDNPGPMTLTGTNSYVLQVGAGRASIVDPGPDDTAHRAALIAAVGGSGGANTAQVDVLLTHHHDDHEGGAAALVDELRAGGVMVNRWGGARGDTLRDGQTFGDLQAIAAPGHTADSVAFVLVRAGRVVLFSGDTLLGGSSSFIAHPDGDLTAYLVTLDVLDAALAPWPDAVLAPGHGDVGGSARGVIAEYRKHREQRLDEVRAALAGVEEAGPSGAGADPGADADRRVDVVISAVYGGVDMTLRPAVEAIVRAQLAHLDRVGWTSGQSR